MLQLTRTEKRLNDRILVESDGEEFLVNEYQIIIISPLEDNKEIPIIQEYELDNNGNVLTRSKENPNNFINPVTGRIYSIKQ